MLSNAHSNRSRHNRLVYEIGDSFLNKYIPYYKGVLYDLGCGETPYKNFFLQYAESYIGVDWSSTLHDLKADIVANLNEPLPIETRVADTVVSFSVMEHLCEPQVMLGEAFRILRPGGTIILQVPFQWGVHEAPYDFYRYTPFGLRYMFEKAGFKDIAIEPAGGFFTNRVLKFNYFSYYHLIRGPRPLRFLLKYFWRAVWFISQKFAPHLDKLDRDWQREASGYWVTAKK